MTKNIKEITFNEYVKTAREKRGWSQTTFSKLLIVSRSHVSKIESGNHIPSINVFFDICVLLKVNAKDMKELLSKVAMIKMGKSDLRKGKV